MSRARSLAVGLAAFLGPPAALAPESQVRRPEVPDLAAAVALCRAQEANGWELVDFATRLVNDKYDHYSAWHLWLTPQRSFSQCHGLSLQYNQALAEVLEQLGFEVAVVQAARVRHAESRPWWLAGHVWLQVSIDAQVRDVCAGNGSNRPGQVDFVPMSDVRPFRTISHLALSALGSLPVAQVVWRSWLRGDDVPRWLYRKFTH